MSAFNIWRENPPPRDSVVMARYALTDDEPWRLFRTCKRGCCVFTEPNDGMGSMIPPRYWREPTSEEMATPSTRTDRR